MFAGDVADNPVAFADLAEQDIIGGVTIGTLSLSGDSDGGWTIVNTNGITFNNNGNGAVISNSNASTGTFNQLLINGGVLTLADNLRIENTGGSTNGGSNSGAIRFGSASSSTSVEIIGTGDVTFHNDAPIGDLSILENNAYASAIGFFSSNSATAPDSTYTGGVLIEKGLVVFNRGTHFGDASNVITIGAEGQGDAALISPAFNANYQVVPYDIAVAANSGGNLSIGRISESKNNVGEFAGDIMLNGDLQLVSRTASRTIGVLFSGDISGDGGIEKIGVYTESGDAPYVSDGVTFGTVHLTGTNTYDGDTKVTEGVLIAFGNAIPNGAGKGNVILGSAGTLRIRSDEMINGLSNPSSSLGSIVNNAHSDPRTLTIGDGDATSTFSGIIQNGNNATNDSNLNGGAFSIAKIGAGTLTLDGANTYTGMTSVNGGTLLVNGTHIGSQFNPPDDFPTPTPAGEYTIGDTGAGTLGGIGAIEAPVSVHEFGTISPGDATGTLTVGELTVNEFATFAFDLDPSNPDSTSDDLLAVTGNVHLSGPTVNLAISSTEFGGGAFSTTGSWLLVDGATLTGTPPTTVNFNFVEGLSGVTPSLDVDTVNGNISLVLTAGVAGDYNQDGVVTAADYVVWRDTFVGGNPDGYNTWRANFGTGSGAGTGAHTSASIPEPGTLTLLTLGAILLCGTVRQRNTVKRRSA
jgi:autotransporter-associated beta strand protein